MNNIQVPDSVFHPSFYESQHKTLPENRRTLNSINEERGESLQRLSSLKFKSPGMHKFTVDDSAPRSNVNAHSRTYSSTLLSDMFFSQKNVKNIQNLLKQLVYKHTQQVISDQSNRELSIIMNSIYLEYHRFPGEITNNMTNEQKRELSQRYTKEVHRLNQIVLNEITPKVISQIEAYKNYLYDASRQPETIPQPQNQSIKGTRQYRSVTQVLAGSSL